MVCTLRGVSSEAHPAASLESSGSPQYETSTGKVKIFIAVKALNYIIVIYLLVHLFMQSDPSVFKFNKSLNHKLKSHKLKLK